MLWWGEYGMAQSTKTHTQRTNAQSASYQLLGLFDLYEYWPSVQDEVGKRMIGK